MSLIGNNIRTTLDKETKEGDNLNLHLLDLTNGRYSRNIYDRNTFFGSNMDVDTTERRISPTADSVGLEISFPASARILSIASTNATDDAVCIVRGLDSNFDELDEEITLTGQTEVDTIALFNRIQDIFVKTSNTNSFNLGNIYVSDSTDTFTLGVPQTRIYFAMEIGDNIGKSAVYTVPRGFRWTPTLLYLQSTATEANPLEVRVYQDNRRQGGNTFQLRDKFYVAGDVQIDMSHNVGLTELSDIYMTAQRIGGGANQEVHIKMFAILQKNE